MLQTPIIKKGLIFRVNGIDQTDRSTVQSGYSLTAQVGCIETCWKSLADKHESKAQTV